jgi:hypothetical protein
MVARMARLCRGSCFMSRNLPQRLANGARSIVAKRRGNDGLSPGQRQVNARPAPEATDMAGGIHMHQCTGGACRAARRQHLSVEVCSWFVRLCVPQGRLVSLRWRQFG